MDDDRDPPGRPAEAIGSMRLSGCPTPSAVPERLSPRLVVANLVDLSAIASVGSAVALVIFLLVGAAGYRRRADTASNPIIVVLAIAVTATVLAFFALDTLQSAPETFGAIIAIGLLSVVLDALVRRRRPDRRPPNRRDRGASASPTG